MAKERTGGGSCLRRGERDAKAEDAASEARPNREVAIAGDGEGAADGEDAGTDAPPEEEEAREQTVERDRPLLGRDERLGASRVLESGRAEERDDGADDADLRRVFRGPSGGDETSSQTSSQTSNQTSNQTSSQTSPRGRHRVRASTVPTESA